MYVFARFEIVENIRHNYCYESNEYMRNLDDVSSNGNRPMHHIDDTQEEGRRCFSLSFKKKIQEENHTFSNRLFYDTFRTAVTACS